MSTGLPGIIRTLETLAEYDGPWRVFRGETALLRARLDELREREHRLDDVLLVALVGGSGVGKSTLLNALAGDQIAETSEMRPCTSLPTVYHPPGMQCSLAHLAGVRHIARSALERIALIDTPDSDTIVKEHRRIVEQVLQECDLILLCADGEKYLDEATWSLLYPLRGLRAMVCVETRVNREDTTIREHWLARLHEEGFQVGRYFRVNALRALDRKLTLSTARENEFEFNDLELFLHHELDRERVARIKSSNAAGLLAKTVERLHECVGEESPRLKDLKEALDEGDRALTQATLRHFTAGPLSEAHLWVQALGREVGIRAKGGIGTLYRIIEVVRSLPYRIPALFGISNRPEAGEIAAVTFFGGQGQESGKTVLPDGLSIEYAALRSKVRLRFIQAGFEMPEAPDAQDFQEELEKRVRAVFQGPVREGFMARARWLCAWPVAVLLDSLPLALLVYTAYLVLNAYYRGELLPSALFTNTGIVLIVLLVLEVMALSTGVRLLAWSMRHRGLRMLRKALARDDLAFKHEKQLLKDIEKLRQTVQTLREEVAD